MVGDVDDIYGELPVFAQRLSRRYIERGMHRQIVPW